MVDWVSIIPWFRTKKGVYILRLELLHDLDESRDVGDASIGTTGTLGVL